VGQLLLGRVTRVAEFGAFIELEPGIEALAHASSIPSAGKKDSWKASVPEGASVAVEILSIDLERKRIGVGLQDRNAVDEENAARDYKESQDRVQDEESGLFAEKLRAAMRRKQDP
jgi:small subunit ribosomal protein S1